MRGALTMAFGIAVVMGLSVSAASAQVTRGNDTGGIIPWSCENENDAPRLTAEFCARWDKYPRITGVDRQYGNYISFNCLWSPRVARWALPKVRTRSRICEHAHSKIIVKALD